MYEFRLELAKDAIERTLKRVKDAEKESPRPRPALAEIILLMLNTLEIMTAERGMLLNTVFRLAQAAEAMSFSGNCRKGTDWGTSDLVLVLGALAPDVGGEE